MLKAVFWSSFERISFQAINLFLAIIIARYLGPSQVAIVAIITGYVYFLNIFVDSGLTISIIRNKNITQQEISSIFYFNLTVSILFILLTILSADAIESYFDISELGLYLKLSSLILLFNSISFVRYAIMEQKMEFKILSFINLAAIVVSGAISVLLLYKELGIIAAILFPIISSFIRNTLFLIFTPKFKLCGFNYQILKPHLKFGKNLLFSSSIEAIYNNGFPILITKLFTGYSAGIFFQAKKLVDGPVVLFSSSSRRIFLPMASKYENEKQKTFVLLIQILKFTSFSLALILGVLYLNSSYLILTLLGKEWNDSILVFQILLFGMIFYPPFFLCTDVFKVHGDSEAYSKTVVFTRVGSIIIVLFSSIFGFLYLVTFISVVQFLMFLFAAYSIEKKYNYSFGLLVKAVIPFVLLLVCLLIPMHFLNFYNQNLIQFLKSIILVISFIFLSNYLFKFNPIKMIYHKMIKK